MENPPGCGGGVRLERVFDDPDVAERGPWSLGAGEPLLVSVVVPTFNRVRLLPETLDSVFAQTYRPIELIVVDDGSTDATSELVEAWGRQKAGGKFEVRYDYQQNRGAPAARNRGTSISRGAYLQYLDSDDLLGPEKIASQVAALVAIPTAEFAYGPVVELENPARTIYCQTEMSSERMVLKQIVVPTFQSAVPLCSRTMITTVGRWREDLAPLDDWEYFSRAAVLGCPGTYVTETVVYHRMEVADRLRWRGEPDRLEQYLYARISHLRSMLRHARQDLAVDRRFRAAIAVNLAGAVAGGVLAGWKGDDLELYRRAHSIAGDAATRLLLGIVLKQRTWIGRAQTARAIRASFWAYYRLQAARNVVARYRCRPFPRG